MRQNRTKAKLSTGEAVFGVIATTADPELVEIVGLAGFDFYLLDAEHGSVGVQEAAQVARACECVDITPVARVVQPELITQFLDAGIMGIMAPDINSPAQARALVQAIKYPPAGQRGIGGGRAARHHLGAESQADYVATANRETMVWPQFEDPAAFEHLNEIISVPGIDGLVIGRLDLALKMGFADGPNHPEVDAIVQRVTEAARSRNLPVGSTATTAEIARVAFARGMRITLNPLPNLIRQAARSFFDGAKAYG